jgi:hypothetical protein
MITPAAANLALNGANFAATILLPRSVTTAGQPSPHPRRRAF